MRAAPRNAGYGSHPACTSMKAKKKDVHVLILPDGKVQLNRTAAAILELCDGLHDRDDLVAEVVRRSNEQARAVEIIEFLDAARARGWIDEV